MLTMGIFLFLRMLGSVLDSLALPALGLLLMGDGWSPCLSGEAGTGLSGIDCRSCRRAEMPSTREGEGMICCLGGRARGCGTVKLGVREGGTAVITGTLVAVGLEEGVWKGVWTPEKSPTAPQCTLAPSCGGSGTGESGAGGRFTVGGVSLRDIEHWTAPSLTSLLCVLQILLYCQLTFLLGGAGLVEHSLGVVLGVGGAKLRELKVSENWS